MNNSIDDGYNPFPKVVDTMQTIRFSLESILYGLNLLPNADREKLGLVGANIVDCNFNPYVYDNLGNKYYYQRELCWSIADKQKLINSIYQGIDCGKIVVRKNTWDKVEQLFKNGETELSWYDVVDGKQRLNAIVAFINNEFPDTNGNYFKDFSKRAHLEFLQRNMLFTYCEMYEDVTDEQVIQQFLRLNITGIPQSVEHIMLVNNIWNRVTTK